MLRILRISLLVLGALLVGNQFTATVTAADNCPNCQRNDCPNCRAKRAKAGECFNCRSPQYGRPDLFYNFYANDYCRGQPAQLYVAPLPVPAHVGHTFYTYQPLMPHEMLYKHHRTYYRYYDGGRGMTRTSVRWR